MSRPVGALVLATAALIGACGSGGSDPATTELRVLAAASLTEVFNELATTFEKEHPDVDVELSFGASSALAQQVIEGAAAGVLVSADEETMGRVLDSDVEVVGEPVVVARNRLAVVVERGNPKQVRTLDDLGRSDVVVVLCAPQVPCGRLAKIALDRAAVGVSPASLEENVKGVVGRVTLGEADAGIVYATDARAAGARAEAVPVAGLDGLEAVYPAVTLTDSDAARSWIELLGSSTGRDVFIRFGFLRP